MTTDLALDLERFCIGHRHWTRGFQLGWTFWVFGVPIECRRLHGYGYSLPKIEFTAMAEGRFWLDFPKIIENRVI